MFTISHLLLDLINDLSKCDEFDIIKLRRIKRNEDAKEQTRELRKKKMNNKKYIINA